MSKHSSRYSDIIDLPHHQSIYRPHMTVYNRAAQFAPFVALVGYDQMTKDTADILLLDKRVALSEDQKSELNWKLHDMLENSEQNPEIEVIYYDESANKLGGGYVTYSGRMKELAEHPNAIVFLDGKKIALEDIVSIL